MNLDLYISGRNYRNTWHIISAMPRFFQIISCIFILLVSVFYSSAQVTAQSGSIIGNVICKVSGEPVTHATMVINDTGHKTATDSNGRFIFRNVSTGEHKVIVKSIGYNESEFNLFVESNQSAEQDFELEPMEVEGDKIYSVQHRFGEARTLSRQSKSNAISSVISSEQIDRFGDYTARDAIARIPGIQVGAMNELNIRGVGRESYNVLVDGQRMPTTGLGTRVMDPSTMMMDMIREIEVVKTVTPDMNADALGGTVHIRTQRPAGSQRNLQARLGGGSNNTRYFYYSGPDSRASLSYTDTPREDFSMGLDLSYQSVQRSWESLGIDYQVGDLGNGSVDLLEQLAPRLNINDQSNLGGRLHLTYQPSNRTTYHAQGIINNFESGLNQHTSIYNAAGDWINPDSTGLQGRRGSYVYDAQLNDATVRQYLFQSGVRHHFDLFDLDINIGWGQSRIQQEYYRLPFHISGMDYSVSMEDRLRPSMQIENFGLMLDGTIDRRLLRFQDFDQVLQNHVDNTYTARIDLEFPFRLGAIKLGSEALLINKKGDYSEGAMSALRPSYLFNFSVIQDGHFDVLDQYHIPWLINSDHARMYIDGTRPSLRRNDVLFFKRSEIWNYKAEEGIYSGYGMGTFEWGGITLIGGVRVEHTDSRYSGRKVNYNIFDRYDSTVDTSQARNYTSYFPNAQIAFSPTDQTRIRLAYSQTIARPDFNLLTPFELANASDTTLFRGNPNLDAMTSENIDVSFDHYFSNVGQIGAGFFYKELSGFIVEQYRSIEIQEGEVDGFSMLFDEQTTLLSANERTFVNSDDKATIYGIELYWQQNLDFLPGFLRNFGTYVNYTWSHSALEVDYRDGEVRFPYQSPHTVNVALLYNQGRFSIQTAYHWTDTSVSQLQRIMTFAPSLNQEVYRDRYEDGARRISMSMRFRISDNFRFWADAVNLLNVERLQYEHTREYYPRVINSSGGGFGFRAGIQFNL